MKAERTAYILTRTNSIPKGSAFIDKTVVSNLKPGPRGENVIWDFTDVEVLDGNVKCEYEVIGDSVLYVTEGGTRRDFRLSGDSLLCGGLENRLTVLSDSISGIVFRYPFAYGDSVSKPFVQKGEYSKLFDLYVGGISTSVCDAKGMLILEPGDTLRNVLRVHRINDSFVMIKGRGVADIQSGNKTRYVEHIYSWYAEGYACPVAEIVEQQFCVGEKTERSSKISYVRYANQLSGIPEVCMVDEYALQKTDSRANGKSGYLSKEYEKGYSGLDVDYTGGTVTLNVEVHRDMTVGATLTNLHGVVFGYIPYRKVSGGEVYSQSLEVGTLLPGEYLLHTVLGEKTEVKAINVE